VNAVLKAPMTEVHGPIRTARTDIDLPFAPADPLVYQKDILGENIYKQRRAKLMLQAYNKGWNVDSYKYPIQVLRFGKDLTILTFGNGLFMSLRVARELQTRGIYARVVDLRWIAPLPVDDILREANATGRVLVVDETRQSGGVSEGVLTALIDGEFRGVMARAASKDSFIPLGDAAKLMLLSEAEIETAVNRLLAQL